MPNEVTLTPRQVIGEIREDFLIDDDGLSERAKRGAKSLRKNLNSALRLLSDDLYSNKSHFVLELVQNADDNDYARDVRPELLFELLPRRLVLSNNEVGFIEDNVRAICKVGESSKPASKHAHIGEKGIGFKAVFAVSDAPEIHSNGYHFRFDRTDPDQLLGYVVPYWCDAPEGLPGFGTTIILPAAGNLEFDQQQLAELDSRALLFLNKLRRMTLQVGTSRKVFERIDKGRISVLTTTTTDAGSTGSLEEQRYVRVSRPVDMTGERADPKRTDVDTTNLTLAFPIERSGKAQPDPASHVFAFLPIHQAGFRFSIHADFLLSSSRETILKDKNWNRALRDNIAAAFVQAVEGFRRSDSLGLTYLKYVPATNEVADAFFAAVRPTLIRLLSETTSLRSALGKWTKPSDLRQADASFRALFPSHSALTLFGFDYVDTRMEAGAGLLRELGLKDASLGRVLEVFKFHSDWIKAQPLEWRAQLYAYIADRQKALMAEGLLKVNCLPTSDDKYLVPETAVAFFPLGRGKKYGFESALAFVDIELYDAALALSPAVASLFEAMRVRTDDPYDLVVSYILPLHKGEGWKSAGFIALTGHLRYVKDKLAQYLASAENHGKTRAQAIQLLRDGIRIGTKQVNETQWIFGAIISLYLAREFKPSFCLETLIPNDVEKSQLVSATYLAPKARDPDGEARSWREFLIELGVRVSPAVAAEGADWTPSKELLALLESTLPSTRRATLECLSVYWDVYAGKLTQGLQLVRGKWIAGPSKFALAIRGMQAPIKGRRKSVPLSESYYPSTELTTLLGETLPYVDVALPVKMLDDCGVTHRVDANALLKRLRQLKKDGTGSSSQIQAIYRVLDERFWSTSSALIRDAFESDGLIFLRAPHKGWYAPSQVTRRSNNAFLDTLYPPIQSSYKDFNRFFIEHLGVSRELPVANWVAALLKLDQLPDVTQRISEALAIYKRANKELGPRFGQEVAVVPDWIATFQSEPVYVDQHGDLVYNHVLLFANDRPEVAALFADVEDISFIAVDPSDVPRLARLFREADVECLSERIETHVLDAEEGALNLDLTHRVNASVPYFARYLYAKYPETFEKVLEAGEMAKLWRATVHEVSTLRLAVDLGEYCRETTTEAAFDDDNRILYLTGTKVLKDRIANLISNRLLGTSALSEAFARILYDEGDGGIEDLFGVWNVQPLPDDLTNAVEAQRFGLAKAVGSDEDDDANAGEELPSAEEQSSPPSAEGKGASSSPRPMPGTSETAGSEGGTTPSGGAPGPASPGALGNPRPSADPPHQTPSGWTSAFGTRAPSPSGQRVPSAGAGSQSPQPTEPRLSHQGVGSASGLQTPAPGPERHSSTAGPRTNANGNSSPENSGSVHGAIGSAPASSSPNAFDGARSASPQRGRGGRLLSYVESGASEGSERGEANPEQATARDSIARAAVAFFLKSQSWRWKSLTEMPHFNPGYDVSAIPHSGEEEFVEVKGQSGAWSYEGVVLTPKELETARKMGHRYWLCVVEFAEDDGRRQLHLVRDPFGQISQFRFDIGWKAAAEIAAAAPQVPIEGLFIDIEGVGLGRIASVTGAGSFFKVTINLKDGKQVTQVFNPAKMRLSEEPLWQE